MLRKYPTHILRSIIPAAHKARRLPPFQQSSRPIFNHGDCLSGPSMLATFPRLLKSRIHELFLRDGLAPVTEFSIEGISANDYDQLMKDMEQDRDEIWEKFRIDISRDALVVKAVGFGHEILQEIIAYAQGLPINSASPLPKIDLKADPEITAAKFSFGGSTDIALVDGKTQPDLSIYPPVDHSTDSSSPAILTRALRNGTPTVIFEVGYSQKSASLNHTLVHAIGGSVGAVRLAIGIKISHSKTHTKEKSTRATVTAWSFSSAQPLESYKGPTNKVIPSKSARGQPPREYTYVCKTESGLVSKLTITQAQEFNILPDESGGDIVILNRHLYRKPEPSLDDNAVAFTIPVPIIRRVVQMHEERQSELDLVKRLGKQKPYDNYHEWDEWNREIDARPGTEKIQVGRDSKKE
ncbi:hypothetical protein BJ138DRAFT_1158176 [Hygrophoropsis aurantiaca]|uniref:Uncharacterized protein n=1 Tax=Hygrophoropsis aurantiaca TaxID=72124 RepID=A0ACB8A4S4_9AGAM|nr:hypothetical protein BJ138DRAFT_1158176 [Hygrophoropsis aurantiaca]